MPEPLWEAAVALAREHGLYATSRDLHVCYDSLKARLERSRRQRAASQPAAAPAFVELGAALPFAGVASGTSVELTATDGSRLLIDDQKR
ncbi:MAG: hypothetical protein HY744_30575 [Deltaproteobacteria bacterium]|nr:hypothetical protein [Deltaproteobacteria bacterium]